MTSLLILYLAGGGLLVLLSLPLYFEKIPPNGLYGFRVEATLKDPKLWYAVNRFSAKRQSAAGLALAATALVLFNVPYISEDTYALGCLLVFAVVFIIGLVQSFRYMRQAATPQEKHD